MVCKKAWQKQFHKGCLLVALNFEEPLCTDALSHLNASSSGLGLRLKASLEACITKLVCLNWIAGFRAQRVKDNSGRVSLAGCQWTMQSRPQLTAAGRAHAGVHIGRDSLRCFDGSVIAASVCPQPGVQVFTTNNVLLSQVRVWVCFSFVCLMCLKDETTPLITKITCLRLYFCTFYNWSIYSNQRCQGHLINVSPFYQL